MCRQTIYYFSISDYFQYFLSSSCDILMFTNLIFILFELYSNHLSFSEFDFEPTGEKDTVDAP